MPILRSSTGTTSSTRRVSVLYRRTGASITVAPEQGCSATAGRGGGGAGRGGHFPAGPGARTDGRRLPVPGQDPDGDLHGLAFTEIGHESLDLVANELLALDQRVTNAFHRVPLLKEHLLDPSPAVVEERVHLLPALG